MKGIQICPNCGQPTLKVKENSVKNQLINQQNLLTKGGKWQVCVNDKCDIVYIKDDIQIPKGEIKPVVFFKDRTDNALICFCYKITRGDIRLAIGNGCESVGEVYKYLKKSKTGSCSTNNPLGKSCSNVFKYTFNQLKNEK